MIRQSTEKFKGSENTLYNTMMDAGHTFIQTQGLLTPRVSHMWTTDFGLL